MKDSREKIFAAIRRGLRGSEKSHIKRGEMSPLKRIPDSDFGYLFAKFSSELKNLGGEAVVFGDDESAMDFIVNHAGENVFVYGELGPWHKRFGEYSKKPIRTSFDFESGYDKREVAAFDSAVSPCVACIAETGTVVVANTMRLPAALATKLFVVAKPNELVSSLDELFTDEKKNFAGSNLFLITGPSRTADIEKELVTGVHGPKEVYVIFISRSSR